MAERDQLNWSAEESSKSRQSETAVERRKSPSNLVNGEKMAITCCTTSMVERIELENWEAGTVKHSIFTRSGGEVAESMGNKRMKKHQN